MIIFLFPFPRGVFPEKEKGRGDCTPTALKLNKKPWASLGPPTAEARYVVSLNGFRSMGRPRRNNKTKSRIRETYAAGFCCPSGIPFPSSSGDGNIFAPALSRKIFFGAKNGVFLDSLPAAPV